MAFLQAAITYYASLGIPIRALLTDNGHCYRSFVFRDACLQLALNHRFTRPYTPRTNGKAERFIQTALREWAYACTYLDSRERNAQLSPWLHNYNWHRPHGSLNRAAPISRAGLDQNNLLRCTAGDMFYRSDRAHTLHLARFFRFWFFHYIQQQQPWRWECGNPWFWDFHISIA